MAADGWYAQWYAGGWFPSVWFAPAHEDQVEPETPPKRGGMSYEQALAATLGWRAAQEILDERKKRKRRGRRAREREQVALLALPL